MAWNRGGALSGRRVLLIEWKGASLDFLSALAERSVMPRVAGLLESAASTSLPTTPNLGETSARATFWTGCRPTVHGVIDDFWLDARRSRLRTHRMDRLARPTLCQSVETAFGPAAVVRLEDFDRAGFPWHDAPADLATLRRRAAETRTALRQLAARAAQTDSDRWRLMTIRLRTLQGLQHHLGNALPAGDRPGANLQWIDVVAEVLRAWDQCLAELSRLARHRGAALVVASSCGVVPYRGRITLCELLQRAGLLRLRRGVGALPYHVSRLRWKARRSLGRRAGSARPLAVVLPIDWRRTSVVTLHGQSAAMVYLNTRERFGTRVLRTASAEDRAAEAALNALIEARHPTTNERLFVDAFRTDARFGPAALRHGWPEVIGIPAAGFQTRHRTDRKGRLVRDGWRQTGTSGGAGLLLVDSPGIAAGRHEAIPLEEVAHVVLDLLNSPKAEGSASKSLLEAIGDTADTAGP
ncbi:MAG: alkaline phosphatase family protein [Pirellulales bacterium]|nr:alkaline phosphatase family protein [Pirellulales bacterium]